MFRNAVRAFKQKNYRLYFVLQLFSFTGTWMQATALSWFVYRLTGSALFLGATNFVGAIPALFLAPMAGVVADRVNRRYILLATQGLCLVHGTIVAVLYFSGHLTQWHVLFLAIFLGIANSFDMTARQSFTPLLIPKEDLTNAIALNSTMFNTSRMLGPAIAGFLIAAYGEGPCFALNAVSFIPIIIFITWVETRKQIIKKSVSVFGHLKEGFSFAGKHKPIITLLLMVGTFSFWGASFTTLLPIFSDQMLNSGAKGLGILTGASGIGAISGGVFLASRQKVIGIKKIIAITAMISSVSISAFAFSSNFVISCVLLAIVGFCFILIFAGSNTLLQALSPDHLRGRVISLFSTMLMGMYPLGSLTVGFIAQNIGISLAVLIGASFCFLAGLYFNLRVPSLVKDAKELLEIQKQAEGIIHTRRI